MLAIFNSTTSFFHHGHGPEIPSRHVSKPAQQILRPARPDGDVSLIFHHHVSTAVSRLNKRGPSTSLHLCICRGFGRCEYDSAIRQVDTQTVSKLTSFHLVRIAPKSPLPPPNFGNRRTTSIFHFRHDKQVKTR